MMGEQSEQNKKRAALISKWRRFLGLCHNCGAEANGNLYCADCRKKGAVWYKKAQATKKRKVQKRRVLGLCLNCGAQAKGKSSCDRCRKKKTEYQRAMRLKWKKKNLCRECGKVEVNKGQYRCDECLKKMRARPGNPLKASPELPLVNMKKMIKDGVVKVCKTDGCNNITSSFNLYCIECKKIRTRLKSKIYYITCRDCKTTFIQGHPNIKDQRCNKCARLANADQQQNRKALIRGNYIEYVSIKVLWLRDGGKCQLCGKGVNLRIKYPKPKSASRDHITPISKGGEHSYKNTQLTHLGCNMKKGNRGWPGGEQTRMFG